MHLFASVLTLANEAGARSQVRRSHTMKKLSVIVVLSGLALARAAAGASVNQTAESDLAYNTGRNYLSDGRADLAIDHFKKAVSLDDKNYFAYKGLGIAYAQQQNYKEAERVQRRCLDLNPDFADARNDLATTLVFLGRPEEARKEWMTAHASPFNPSPEQTASNLAQSYVDEKNYAEAARWYQTALQKNDAYPRGYVGLAAALLGQNRLDEAMATLEKGLAKAPADNELLYMTGDAYFKAGRFADARARLEAVIKADPSGPYGRRAAEQLKHFPK